MVLKVLICLLIIEQPSFITRINVNLDSGKQLRFVLFVSVLFQYHDNFSRFTVSCDKMGKIVSFFF